MSSPSIAPATLVDTVGTQTQIETAASVWSRALDTVGRADAHRGVVCGDCGNHGARRLFELWLCGPCTEWHIERAELELDDDAAESEWVPA